MGVKRQKKKNSYNSFLIIFKEKVQDLGYNPDLYGTDSGRAGGATQLAPFVSPFEMQLTGRRADARLIRNNVEVDRKRHLFL